MFQVQSSLAHRFLFLTSRSINAKVLSATSSVDPVLLSSRTLSAPPVEHKRTCATCQQRHASSVCPVLQLSRTLSASLLSISEHVQNANNGSKVPGPCLYSRQESYQTPLLSIRERHVNNGNKFLGPCLKVVKNLISPPHPPPAEQKRACATCQQRQISHIPKTTILPRAAYQPHATNNLRLERVVRARFVCINDHEQGPNILKLRWVARCRHTLSWQWTVFTRLWRWS